MVLAGSVAVLHGAAVLLMLTGALLALRWPRLVLVHAPVALAVLAVNLAGAACPLTTLELALRERAGAAPYDGGFLAHYVYGPLGLDVAATSTQVGTYLLAFGLNALGYGLLLARARRGAQPSSPATAQASTSPRTTAPAASHARRDRTPATAMPSASGMASPTAVTADHSSPPPRSGGSAQSTRQPLNAA
ncbi:DUF2784 family protein [Geodermatophilus sp. SYSU D00696]